MELAVLLKGVPRSESTRFDPARYTLVREGAELAVNPLDQRALRVALELRRPDETVTALSLGPPAVAPLLREARALGADRAWHLTDPAFAGSDILATSRALAAALERVGPALVLAGARSTDSDTGLVGPEVAARLGVPVVPNARALRRSPAGRRLEVDVETRTGWATVEVEAPVVVTVGEKIAKPLHPTPEQFAAAGLASVQALGATDLDLSPAEVGAFGSPTTVAEVRAVAPHRDARRYAEGTIAARVAQAMGTLRPRLELPPAAPPPLPWPPSTDPDHEVLVLATDEAGRIEPDVPGIVTHLRRSLPAFPVSAALYGPATEAGPLERAGVLYAYGYDPQGRPFDSGDVARAIGSLLDHRPRLAAVVAAASEFGRAVAGQLAAEHSLGGVGDAIAVRADPDGNLAWSKPSFGGTTLATVRCRSRPVVATVTGGLTLPAADGHLEGGLRAVPWPAGAPLGRVLRKAEGVEPADSVEPEGAEVVVAVGTGIGGSEGIARLRPALDRWRAALVGTRRVVDAGWLPARRQVGLTGRALAPRLAVLLGVRGAANHMVGWGRAAAILAVNVDPEAPVFDHADAGIVGSVDEVVPELVEPVAELLRGGRPR